MADVEEFANLSRTAQAAGHRAWQDVNIQEAIRLHEAGDLVNSTKMFGRLADPNGENDPLSQVLYGLALRYVNWPLYAGSDNLPSHGRCCRSRTSNL